MAVSLCESIYKEKHTHTGTLVFAYAKAELISLCLIYRLVFLHFLTAQTVFARFAPLTLRFIAPLGCVLQFLS